MVMSIFTVSGFAEDEATEPKLDISFNSLSYSSEIYVAYAVSYSGFEPSETPITMLFWNEAQDNFDYSFGTQDYLVETKGRTNIGGVPHYVFYSKGVAPKELADEIYCRACVTIDGTTYYSEPSKYSGLTYLTKLVNNTSTSEADLNLANALINYGEKAQIRFNYSLDDLAGDPHYYIELENGVLTDGFSYGLYLGNSTVQINGNHS